MNQFAQLDAVRFISSYYDKCMDYMNVHYIVAGLRSDFFASRVDIGLYKDMPRVLKNFTRDKHV